MGRHQSIPRERFSSVFQWYAQGLGYRRIVVQLETQGVYTTKSSVVRLIRGLPPYGVGHVFSSPDDR